MTRQFSSENKGDLEDCHDSDIELGPFYDAADRMVQILEDSEPQVEPVAEVESLGTLSVTETPPEVATELLNKPSNEAETLAMTATQLKLAI